MTGEWPKHLANLLAVVRRTVEPQGFIEVRDCLLVFTDVLVFQEGRSDAEITNSVLGMARNRSTDRAATDLAKLHKVYVVVPKPTVVRKSYRDVFEGIQPRPPDSRPR